MRSPSRPADFIERRLIAHLPSDERDVVGAARHQHEPMVIFVHPQEHRAVRLLAIDLEAQHLGGKALPSRNVAHADSQVSQLCDTRHRRSPWVSAADLHARRSRALPPDCPDPGAHAR
jgi:hypothetical protein